MWTSLGNHFTWMSKFDHVFDISYVTLYFMWGETQREDHILDLFKLNNRFAKSGSIKYTNYSFRPHYHLIFDRGQILRNIIESGLKKIGGMWILLSYINFKIK